MLRKCLKYDLKDVLRIWWIGAVTLLVLSVPAGMGLNSFIQASEDTSGSSSAGVFGIFPVIAAYIAIIAFMIVTVILLFRRYYCNFFTDQGYQTFTLPVKRSTLLLSKVICGMVTMLLSLSVVLTAVVIVMALASADGQNVLLTVIREAGPWFAQRMGESVGPGWFALHVCQVALIMVLMLLTNLLFTYLCVTFGAVIAKKHKILATIGLIYGINMVSAFVWLPLELVCIEWMFSMEKLLPDLWISSASGPMGALVLGLGCVAAALAAALLWLMNLGTLERKLNLA